MVAKKGNKFVFLLITWELLVEKFTIPNQTIPYQSQCLALVLLNFENGSKF